MRSEQSSRRSSRNVPTKRGRFSIAEFAVIAVILLLFIAAVFPVRAMVQFQNEKKLAYERAREIEFAIRKFEEEYKKLPIDPQSIKDDFYETTSGKALMAILKGETSAMNPLGVNCFLVPVEEDELRDPWGNLYQVRIDSNSDKFVTLPVECAHEAKISEEGKVKQKAIVWSKGRPMDGEFGPSETWIKSWYRP